MPMVPNAFRLVPWIELDAPIKNGRTKATSIVPEITPPESKAIAKNSGGVKNENKKINIIIGTKNHNKLISKTNLNIASSKDIITDMARAISIYLCFIIPFVTSSIWFNNITTDGSVNTKIPPKIIDKIYKRYLGELDPRYIPIGENP